MGRPLRSEWPWPLHVPRPSRAASAEQLAAVGPDLEILDLILRTVKAKLPGWRKVAAGARPAPSGWTMAQARAVSDAAQAAAQATEAAQAVMASAHEARRIEALSRFIQKPDMYKPDTREQEIDQWTDWRHVMRNYLGVIDAKEVRGGRSRHR